MDNYKAQGYQLPSTSRPPAQEDSTSPTGSPLSPGARANLLGEQSNLMTGSPSTISVSGTSNMMGQQQGLLRIRKPMKYDANAMLHMKTKQEEQLEQVAANSLNAVGNAIFSKALTPTKLTSSPRNVKLQTPKLMVVSPGVTDFSQFKQMVQQEHYHQTFRTVTDVAVNDPAGGAVLSGSDKEKEQAGGGDATTAPGPKSDANARGKGKMKGGPTVIPTPAVTAAQYRGRMFTASPLSFDAPGWQGSATLSPVPSGRKLSPVPKVPAYDPHQYQKAVEMQSDVSRKTAELTSRTANDIKPKIRVSWKEAAGRAGKSKDDIPDMQAQMKEQEQAEGPVKTTTGAQQSSPSVSPKDLRTSGVLEGVEIAPVPPLSRLDQPHVPDKMREMQENLGAVITDLEGGKQPLPEGEAKGASDFWSNIFPASGANDTAANGDTARDESSGPVVATVDVGEDPANRPTRFGTIVDSNSAALKAASLIKKQAKQAVEKKLWSQAPATASSPTTDPFAEKMPAPQFEAEALTIPWLVDAGKLPTRVGDPSAASTEFRRLLNKVQELTVLAAETHPQLRSLTEHLAQQARALNEKELQAQRDARMAMLGEQSNASPEVDEHGELTPSGAFSAWAEAEKKRASADNEYLNLGSTVSPLVPQAGLKIPKNPYRVPGVAGADGSVSPTSSTSPAIRRQSKANKSASKTPVLDELMLEKIRAARESGEPTNIFAEKWLQEHGLQEKRSPMLPPRTRRGPVRGQHNLLVMGGTSTTPSGLTPSTPTGTSGAALGSTSAGPFTTGPPHPVLGTTYEVGVGDFRAALTKSSPTSKESILKTTSKIAGTRLGAKQESPSSGLQEPLLKLDHKKVTDRSRPGSELFKPRPRNSAHAIVDPADVLRTENEVFPVMAAAKKLSATQLLQNYSGLFSKRRDVMTGAHLGASPKPPWNAGEKARLQSPETMSIVQRFVRDCSGSPKRKERRQAAAVPSNLDPRKRSMHEVADMVGLTQPTVVEKTNSTDGKKFKFSAGVGNVEVGIEPVQLQGPEVKRSKQLQTMQIQPVVAAVASPKAKAGQKVVPPGQKRSDPMYVVDLKLSGLEGLQENNKYETLIGYHPHIVDQAGRDLNKTEEYREQKFGGSTAAQTGSTSSLRFATRDEFVKLRLRRKPITEDDIKFKFYGESEKEQFELDQTQSQDGDEMEYVAIISLKHSARTTKAGKDSAPLWLSLVPAAQVETGLFDPATAFYHGLKNGHRKTGPRIGLSVAVEAFCPPGTQEAALNLGDGLDFLRISDLPTPRGISTPPPAFVGGRQAAGAMQLVKSVKAALDDLSAAGKAIPTAEEKVKKEEIAKLLKELEYRVATVGTVAPETRSRSPSVGTTSSPMRAAAVPFLSVGSSPSARQSGAWQKMNVVSPRLSASGVDAGRKAKKPFGKSGGGVSSAAAAQEIRTTSRPGDPLQVGPLRGLDELQQEFRELQEEERKKREAKSVVPFQVITPRTPRAPSTNVLAGAQIPKNLADKQFSQSRKVLKRAGSTPPKMAKSNGQPLAQISLPVSSGSVSPAKKVPIVSPSLGDFLGVSQLVGGFSQGVGKTQLRDVLGQYDPDVTPGELFTQITGGMPATALKLPQGGSTTAQSGAGKADTSAVAPPKKQLQTTLSAAAARSSRQQLLAASERSSKTTENNDNISVPEEGMGQRFSTFFELGIDLQTDSAATASKGKAEGRKSKKETSRASANIKSPRSSSSKSSPRVQQQDRNSSRDERNNTGGSSSSRNASSRNYNKPDSSPLSGESSSQQSGSESSSSSSIDNTSSYLDSDKKHPQHPEVQGAVAKRFGKQHHSHHHLRKSMQTEHKHHHMESLHALYHFMQPEEQKEFDRIMQVKVLQSKRASKDTALSESNYNNGGYYNPNSRVNDNTDYPGTTGGAVNGTQPGAQNLNSNSKASTAGAASAISGSTVPVSKKRQSQMLLQKMVKGVTGNRFSRSTNTGKNALKSGVSSMVDPQENRKRSTARVVDNSSATGSEQEQQLAAVSSPTDVSSVTPRAGPPAPVPNKTSGASLMSKKSVDFADETEEQEVPNIFAHLVGGGPYGGNYTNGDATTSNTLTTSLPVNGDEETQADGEEDVVKGDGDRVFKAARTSHRLQRLFSRTDNGLLDGDNLLAMSAPAPRRSTINKM
ncbi:unnamed protein product [Amoebophrya sp. A120]|nr:unnamed protein product [Amoebophrya sp. A120]|eukprot:GSA120T00010801001.1